MGNCDRVSGSQTASDPSGARTAVGIMADSHGDAAVIRQALDLLAAKGCGRICHLGDVCDSLEPQSAEACLEILIQAGVTILKGNNDHALAVALRGGSTAGRTLARLEGLPMAVELEGALFVHSLPFTRELGPASLIGALGPAEAERFFAGFPQPLLFRGHGHSPEIIWRRAGRAFAQPMAPGAAVELTGRLPCIVTCGALANGHCMVWRPAAQRVENLMLG
jgi:hypothetical protein